MRGESNSFHLVDGSPWPLIVSSGVLLLTTGLVLWMHGYSGGGKVVLGGLLLLCLSVFYWLRDIVRESTYEGQHTRVVQYGLRLGFGLFIVSEVMFFFGFFFSYGWLVLGSSVEIGGVYPGVGVVVLNSLEIPLLNTLILLSSGCTITWCHHGLLCKLRKESVLGLLLTLMLGLLFLGLQVYEYSEGSMSMSDGIYGSLFYLITGFHGLHVLIGVLMIIVSLLRIWKYEQTSNHHLNFEIAAIYWHFVDVVWLLVYVLIYLIC